VVFLGFSGKSASGGKFWYNFYWNFPGKVEEFSAKFSSIFWIIWPPNPSQNESKKFHHHHHQKFTQVQL
jgi:hypothetical protein